MKFQQFASTAVEMSIGSTSALLSVPAYSIRMHHEHEQTTA